MNDGSFNNLQTFGKLAVVHCHVKVRHGKNSVNFLTISTSAFVPLRELHFLY